MTPSRRPRLSARVGCVAALIAGFHVAGCTGSSIGKAPTSKTLPDSLLASADAEPLPTLPRGSFANESLRWRIQLRGIELASLSIITRGIPTHQRTQVISEIETSGVGAWFKHVKDHTVTIVADGVAVSAWSQIEEQGTWRQVVSRFGKGHAKVIAVNEAGSVLYPRSTKLGEVLHTAETGLAALRAWRPAPGERVMAIGVAESRFWLMHFRAGAETSLKVRGKQWRAQPIEGALVRLQKSGELNESGQRRTVTIWISSDERRLPLRIDADTRFGPIRAELVSSSKPKPVRRD